MTFDASYFPDFSKIIAGNHNEQTNLMSNIDTIYLGEVRENGRFTDGFQPFELSRGFDVVSLNEEVDDKKGQNNIKKVRSRVGYNNAERKKKVEKKIISLSII